MQNGEGPCKTISLDGKIGQITEQHMGGAKITGDDPEQATKATQGRQTREGGWMAGTGHMSTERFNGLGKRFQAASDNRASCAPVAQSAGRFER